MKQLSLIATLSLATASPLFAQNENVPVAQNSVTSTVQNVANQIAPPAPRGSLLRTSQGKTEITPVSPTGGLATNPAHAAGTVRTLDSSAISNSPNAPATAGNPNIPNIATGSQLTELASPDLKDPFQTDAATAGLANVANAQRAANTFKIAGVIHSRGERIAAVRSTTDKSIQYVSLNGDNTLRVNSAPDLKLTVLEIKDGSISLEVGDTTEVVYIR